MAEREFRTTPQWPIATTPLTGDELVEIWKDGKQYYVPFSELGGIPAAHQGSHQRSGGDPVGTLDNDAYAIPYLDADGLIDSRVSDASTTTKGKVQLATSGEEDATKAVNGTDSRLKDARPPTAHAAQHIAGTDVIDDATTTNSGLMSAADKVKADATIPEYIPTGDEKAALAGTSGVPSASNPFVTNEDARLELIPSAGEKAALAGTAGTPGENNRYVTEASIGADVAPLEDGVVPSTCLPSYVDDVLEYADLASFPTTGESGKIYVALDTNLTYRWSGSAYTEISKSLALGVTSATAYRGDRGKIAYDHSQSEHAPSDADKTQTAINAAGEKITPVDADAFPVLDSAASNALKKTTLANVKAVLKGYFDSFYSGGGGGGGGTGLDLLGIGKIGTGLSISGVVGATARLAALNSTDVAFIDFSNKELRTYKFNGTSWSLVGTGLSISGVGSPALASLNSTDVAFIDDGNDELRTYRFNGSTWSLVGAGLSISGASYPALAALNSTDVAFIDRSNKELRTYRFNGSTWAQVGTGFSISGASYPALASLSSTDVAFIDDGNKELITYRFNGSTWSQVGTGLSISNVAVPALAALNSTDVAFIDHANKELRTYRFNGSTWSLVGAGLSISGASYPALASLSSTDVAFIDANNGELRTYRFLFGYDSASVNIAADYEVPEIATGKSIVIRRTSAYDGDPVTITPPSGATFEGLASLSLYGQYSFVELERINSTVFAIKTLEDLYEITPTISFGGASTGITYLYNTGDIRVVKGRAYVNLRVTLSSKGIATGAVAIALMDAPPHKPSGVNRVTASVYMYNVTYAGQYGAYMSAGSSLITVGATEESGTQVVLTDANFTNTSTLMVAIEYPI